MHLHRRKKFSHSAGKMHSFEKDGETFSSCEFIFLMVKIRIIVRLVEIIFLFRQLEPCLGFECNFRFLQMPYFGRQAKVCDWIAQQTLVIELPLQLGSRRSQNAVEYLKSPSDLKFDSNNHSIQCAFPPDFMSNIYAM